MDSENVTETPAPVTETPKAETEDKPKKKKQTVNEPKIIRLDTGKHLSRLLLPEGPEDPHWDPRMELEVPEALIESMASEDLPTTIQVVEVREDQYRIVDGRTRVRAVPEANKLRKKRGLPPVVLTLAVVDAPEDDRVILMRGLRSNVRMDSPPTVLAQEISRWLDADISEEEICKSLHIDLKRLHGLVSLLNLPKSVQKLVDSGTVSLTAALNLTKLDAGKVEDAAQKLAHAAKIGQKVTSETVKKVSGADPNKRPATAKEKKQFILDLQSGKLAGKHGEAVAWAAIVAMEMALGTRSKDDTIEALDTLAKGGKVKVNVKQYQMDGKKETESEE